jgi:GNAT superfamily N-acetyltransferase
VAFTRPAALPEQADTVAFSSGNDLCDSWLRHRAAASRAAGLSTFIVTDGDRIAGYYCLGTGAVERARISRRRARRAAEPVPTMILPRLAVDVKYRGRGVGASLVRDAVMRTLTVSRMVGVRILLAHAPNADVRAFYRHFGFAEVSFDPLVVLLRVKDAAGHDSII